MSGELGEFNELIKKLLFHGKDFNEEYEERMKANLLISCGTGHKYV